MGLINKQHRTAVTLCAAALVAASVVGEQEALPHTGLPTFKLHEMTEYVSKYGVSKLVQQRWQSPAIYSAWYMTNRIPADMEEQRQNLNAAREFGEKILGATASVTPLPELGSERNLECANVLIDVAEWLSQRAAYGNYLLAARLRNLGVCALAYAVADTNTDMDGVSNLISRCHLPCDDPRKCAEVVDGELGCSVFLSASYGPRDAAVQRLQARWFDYTRVAEADLSNPTIKEYAESHHVDTNVLADAHGFFKDEPDTRGLSLSARWPKKEHARFLLTFDTDLLAYLESLFLFRCTIGHFPTKTQQTNHPFDSDQKAAFWEAWVNHPEGDRTGKVGLAAYTAYRKILDGRFLDPERSRAQLEQLRKQSD